VRPHQCALTCSPVGERFGTYRVNLGLGNSPQRHRGHRENLISILCDLCVSVVNSPLIRARFLADLFLYAETIECVFQIAGDLQRIAAFNLMALEHVNQFAVSQQTDGR
jgi:hypothetical protein